MIQNKIFTVKEKLLSRALDQLMIKASSVFTEWLGIDRLQKPFEITAFLKNILVKFETRNL